MLIFCPDCQRQLRVPDSAAGKSVKCPACAKVFTAGTGSSAEQIQAPRQSVPAPPPDSFEPDSLDDEARPRRSQRYDGDDIEKHDDFIFRGGGEEAQRRANAGAVWFFVAAGITMVVWILNTIMTIAMGGIDEMMPFGGPDRDAFLAGMLCGLVGCGALIITDNVLLMTAGFQLKSFGVKGWVITGIVVAFGQTLFFGISVFINIIYLIADARDALDHWAPVTVILYGSATVLNCVAGVKAIMVLNNEAVAAEFKRRGPRRRKRRRHTEWY